jgi:intergrase/recombinase
MRYFNRQAVEIDEAKWLAHTLDPLYTKVDRHSYGSTDVVSWWIGMQSPYCAKPIIWCTFLRKFDCEERNIQKAFWFTDEISLAQVRAFHKGLVMEVGIPIGVPRK